MAEAAPRWHVWLVILVPVIAILFCGSGEPWALGAVSVMMGLCFIVAPPQSRVPASIVIPAMLALVLCLGAFLPESFFALPEWRSQLENNLGIPLGKWHSPQPLITFEKWLLLAICIIWLLYCLGRNFTERERQLVSRALVLVFSGIAVTAVILRYRNMEMPSLWRAEWTVVYFGPFPNRNHFSALAAVGSVIGFATVYDAFRRRQFVWIFYALATMPVFAILLLNTSRLGVLMFFAGLATWMLTATFRKTSVQKMAVSVSVLLGLTAVVLLYGRNVIDRFGPRGSVIETVTQDARVRIYSDALKVAADTPVLGIGLGNFEPVFNIKKTHSDSLSRNHHPESDWIWLLIEGGVAVLILSLVAFFAMVKKIAPWGGREKSGRRDRRLRSAAGTGALMLAVQGLADTPLHTVGLGTLAALLAGLAITQRNTRDETQRKSRHILYRLAGIACLVIGALWAGTSTGRPLMPGNSSASFHAGLADSLSRRDDYAGAIHEINSAIAIKPLQWDYYYFRGLYKLYAGYRHQDALDDFARARELEPNLSQIPAREADVWLQFHPPYAIPAYREAIRRNSVSALEMFRIALINTQGHPELRPALRELAGNDPKFLLHYLSMYNEPEEFAQGLKEILKQDPYLKGFTKPQQLQLFQIWAARGDKDQLIAFLEQNAEWRATGWRVLAQDKATKGDFQGAYELASNYVAEPLSTAAPTEPADLERLKKGFLYNPNDLLRGFEYYEGLKSVGRTDDAVSVLEQVAQIPNAPPKVFYEQSQMQARKGDYAKAWEKLNLYLSALPTS